MRNLHKYVKIAFSHQSRSCPFLHACGILMCYFSSLFFEFPLTDIALTFLFQKGCSQMVLFCQFVEFFCLLNTLEGRCISEYIRWILLVRLLDLCFRHLNRSGLIFVGVLQQCLSLVVCCVFLPSQGLC